jgi:WD40 repeat protein
MYIDVYTYIDSSIDTCIHIITDLYLGIHVHIYNHYFTKSKSHKYIHICIYRYIITGTKDGKIQVVDTASGAITVNLQAHTGAVWSLAVRPDGKGFVTGSADKEVKFWDFTVESGGVLGIVLARQLNMSQDVLCCRYSPTKSQVFYLIATFFLLFFDT